MNYTVLPFHPGQYGHLLQMQLQPKCSAPWHVLCASRQLLFHSSMQIGGSCLSLSFIFMHVRRDTGSDMSNWIEAYFSCAWWTSCIPHQHWPVILILILMHHQCSRNEEYIQVTVSVVITKLKVVDEAESFHIYEVIAPLILLLSLGLGSVAFSPLRSSTACSSLIWKASSV